MAILLKRDDLELRLERAGERYVSSRFDWNGLVASIRFRGMELLGQEKPPFQRNPARFGRGLHNEFGINACIGYDDCGVGEWFPKIGTGWLRKDDKPYFFYTDYKLDRLSFECEASGQDGAVFHCESGERNGYAYSYDKRISMTDGGFVIRYTLKNLGSKPLATNEYVHNFLCFGSRRMDRGYTLSFPWNLDPSLFTETTNPDGILSVSGNRVEVTGKTGKQFYLGGLSAGKGEKDGLAASWTLAHGGLGVNLSERGNFNPSAVHLWGWKSVISPEIFFAFRAESGATVEWERVYEVRAF